MLAQLDPFAWGATLYIVLLVSLVWHEAAHALVAMWLGDKTAYEGGQVTLNPIPHMQREPFGTVLLPIGMLLMSSGNGIMGFAHVPIDAAWAYRNPRRAALVSAAGPLSNFLLVLLCLLIAKIMVWSGAIRITMALEMVPVDGSTEGLTASACLILQVFILLNVLLGLLNLIPLPPLDGAGVLGGLFPRSLRRFYEQYTAQPAFMLIGMVVIFFVIWPRVSVYMRPVMNFFIGLIE